MSILHVLGKRVSRVFGLAVFLALPLAAVAQEGAPEGLADDMVGQNEKAWQVWQRAMQAVEREKSDEAAKLLKQIADMQLSELRLALMADRTGSLRLEQFAAGEKAPEVAKTLVEKIVAGRKQRELAEEGWHYAAIGRFKYADASFKALIDAKPDPVALLELARLNKNRHGILIKLLTNVEVGPSAQKMIELLNKGEQMLRTDPYEIAANVAKLGGTPRMVFNATNNLRDSGEYAIPHLLQYLQDATKRDLHPAIIKVLPSIGHGGLNPMCIALGMKDDVTRQVVIKALTEIGYRQALPYLARTVHDSNANAETKAAARQAIQALSESADRPVGDLFHELAEGYYSNEESLRGDVRQDMANVWYLVNNELRYIPVPTPIFNDIMAMRASEEALKADANKNEATALWVAANFRREAKLGLDVESDQPDTRTEKDKTRPDNYPRSVYFARAAGPMYNHMVLSRAVRDRDPGVALGAIAALAATAGEPSLVGAEDVKQPLVQSLTFPNKQVRIKAALALARALPKSPFAQSQNVMPVLSEALAQSGRQSVLIADPEDDSRNKFQAVARAAGMDVAVGSNVFETMSAAQKANLPGYDLILLASDIAKPDLMGAISDLRKNFETAASPILVIAKPDGLGKARDAARAASGVEIVFVEVVEMGDPDKIKDTFMQAIDRAAKSLGMSSLGADMALDLALQAADCIRLVAESGQKALDVSKAEPALSGALQSKSETLRIRAAAALALVPMAEAQTALAEAALDTKNSQTQRVATFGSLAESARRNGNLLADGPIRQVIEVTMKEKDLVLQAAASKALGALDLPSNKASEIIRNQSRG